jgi:bifunctional enzyme CysN/CysC
MHRTAVIKDVSDFEEGHGNDRSKADHWDEFYCKTTGELQPSPFARFVAAECLNQGSRLLEIGCGNGRDAAFFLSLRHIVTAIDASPAGIELCRKLYPDHADHFRSGTLEELAPEIRGPFEAVYTRFVLHAMTPAEQAEALRISYDLITPGGQLLIECRSIKDPLAQLGEEISATERIYGHYRRFIKPDELAESLTSIGFHVHTMVESNGLAPYGDEDPVVIRVVAVKL